VTAALLLLTETPVWAQQKRPVSRWISASKASWASKSESGGSELEFVDALRRHGELSRQQENPAAGLRLYHYTAGLKFELPLTEQSRWDLVADFGLGATRLRSAELANYHVSNPRISETFVSLLGGLRVQYWLADNFHAFVGARQYVYLEDEVGLVIDGLEDPGVILRTSSWTFPITLGVNLSFR
jgi:hypothetical protein